MAARQHRRRRFRRRPLPRLVANGLPSGTGTPRHRGHHLSTLRPRQPRQQRIAEANDSRDDGSKLGAGMQNAPLW